MRAEKILYFDCASGISGDMTLGALLDLGADKEVFLQELAKLDLKGYEISFETVQRNAVTALHVNVLTEEEHDRSHEHDHSHGHDCSHEHEHDHSRRHGHEHEHIHGHEHDRSHEHEHDHGHGHEHSHDHGHEHGRGHFHRSYRDIRRMILESGLKEEVKDLSLRIFGRVAAAEAKVHNRPVEEVQFHEVGAVDSIVDIVGTSILLSRIRPDRICASVVHEGHGFVECQHGMLSVPVPAVSEIFASSDAVVEQIDIDTELVTPTGAEIIAEIADSFGTMPRMKIDSIGLGAGTKILKIPNLLKAVLGSGGSSAMNKEAFLHDEVTVLETNLDDCSGEMLGAAMEILLKEGALDVFYSPIQMKKNRPAWKLTVLARPEDTEKMEACIFRHTTTIGIRKRTEQRSIMPREKHTVQTPFGEMQVKRVQLFDETRDYPEYESAAALARENERSLWEILESYGKA